MWDEITYPFLNSNGTTVQPLKFKIGQMSFWNLFIASKCLIFKQNFIKICYLGHNWQSGNGQWWSSLLTHLCITRTRSVDLYWIRGFFFSIISLSCVRLLRDITRVKRRVSCCVLSAWTILKHSSTFFGFFMNTIKRVRTRPEGLKLIEWGRVTHICVGFFVPHFSGHVITYPCRE